MKTARIFRIKAIVVIAMIFLTNVVSAQDATSLYNEGVQFKKDNKSKEAAEKFRKALSSKPDYVDAQYELGWCLNDLKDYTGAIETLRKARKSWGDYAKVHFELGWAFENTSQTDSAVKSYTECLRLKSDYSGALKQMGYISYDNDSYYEALGYFQKFEAAKKDDIADYKYWYRKGYMLNATKDYSNAVAALKRSLQYKTDYLNTYLELGFAYTKLKMDDDAINYFTQASQLDPKSHIPYNGIAEVYRDNKKDYTTSMQWYQKALAINSTERKACFGMGYCLNATGKYSEAASYLKTAIQQESNYVAAFVELGYSQYMLANYSEALDNLNKATTLNPKNENARYYAGLVYIRQSNKAMAQKMADELRRLDSKLAGTLQTKVDAL